MQQYDVALKTLLRGNARVTLRELIGVEIKQWHNVELPRVQNLRADLLGDATDGSLVQIELQSGNDRKMGVRLARYGLFAYDTFRRFPRQVVLYVGQERRSMRGRLRLGGLSLNYRVVDIRKIKSERLLASESIGDNVIAILARLGCRKRAIRQVLGRIAVLPDDQRGRALTTLLVLAGLRKVASRVEREAKQMPILENILDHEVLGREYKRGLKQGLEKGLERGLEKGIEKGKQKGVQEGMQRGMQKGLHEGAERVVRRLIENRFGPLPEWASARLGERSNAELEELGLLVAGAKSLKELLR